MYVRSNVQRHLGFDLFNFIQEVERGLIDTTNPEECTNTLQQKDDGSEEKDIDPIWNGTPFGSSFSIRMIIYKLLNVCPFYYIAVATSGKVEIP